MSWKLNKRWSDKFLPEIKSILGKVLIAEPPVEEDQERNTDLIVLKMEPVRICCRIRRHRFIDKQDEFTIRSHVPSGNKTELAKIIEGYGDYILYGICDIEEKCLESWIVGNLNVFRLWFNYELIKRKGEIPGIRFENTDGSSAFRVFKINDIGNGFIVAQNQISIYEDVVGL